MKKYTTWNGEKTRIDELTVLELLEKLTDDNLHTERVLIEAIIDGREHLIEEACEVCIDHLDKGYMTDENLQKRTEIARELDRGEE